MTKSIIKTLLILAITSGGLFVLIAKADRVIAEDVVYTTSLGEKKPGILIYND